MGDEPNLETVAQESDVILTPIVKRIPFPSGEMFTLRQAMIRMIPVMLLFEVVALLFHFRALSSLTLPHIIEPEGTFQFQEVVDGFPVPNLLAWNLLLVHWMMWFDRLTGYPLWLGTFFCIALIGVQCVSLVNPTFRLINVSRTEKSNGAHVVALDSLAVSKTLNIALRAVIPLAIVWLLTARFPSSFHFLATLLRCVTIGTLFWVGFDRRGMAGDFSEPKLQKVRAESVPGLMGKAVIFGLGASLLFSTQIPLPTQEIMTYYHTLATFHRAFWWQIAVTYLCSGGFIAGAIGILLFVMSCECLVMRSRLFLGCGLLLCAPSILLIGKTMSPAALSENWDIRPETLKAITFPYSTERPRQTAGIPDGIGAGKVLMQEAGIAPPRRDGNPLLFFSRRGVANLRQMHFTEDGLPLDAASEKAVTEFLKKRNYMTSLSWICLKHIYNVGASNFDTNKSLSACMLSLQKAPHSYQIMTTLQMMLFTCAATKDNLVIVDQLADERYFTHFDRASKRVMGDLYLRFGESEKAMDWYRRAEMPKSYVRRVQTSKPMFNVGRITGTLILNGKPLAGVKVGVHPVRLNGLPKTLEMLVLRSGGELFAPFEDPRYPLFPRFHPRPFALRWVTAGTTTDQKGKFTIDHLIEGEYELVCALPDNIALELPFDSRMKIKNPAEAVTLNYNVPVKELGTMEITAPVSKNTLTFDSPKNKQPADAPK